MDTIDFDFKTSGYDLTGEPEDEFLYNGKSYGCISGLPSINLPEDKLVKFKNPMDYFNSAYNAPYTCKWKIENWIFRIDLCQSFKSVRASYYGSKCAI